MPAGLTPMEAAPAAIPMPSGLTPVGGAAAGGDSQPPAEKPGFGAGLYESTVGPVVNTVGQLYQKHADIIHRAAEDYKAGNYGHAAAGLLSIAPPLPDSPEMQTATDMVKGAVKGLNDEWTKAGQKVRAGNYMEAAGHMLASLIPVIGPAAAKAGEDIGKGNVGEGLGEATGLVGTMLAPEAGKTSGDLAERSTEFRPGSVAEKEAGTADWRPANLVHGPINRAVGSTVRDVRYGDPSKAIIKNKIITISRGGQMKATAAKLDELRPQLTRALAAAKAPVDALDIVTNVIQDASKKLNEAVISNAERDSAQADLDLLKDAVIKRNPSGKLTAAQANEVKQYVGDAVNWEKRPSPMQPVVEAAFRSAYEALKNAVNYAAPGTKDINDRFTDLLALRSSLRDAALKEAAGRGEFAGMNLTGKAEAAVGRVAPAVVVGAQKVASAVKPAVSAVRPAVVAGTAAQQNNNQ